MLGVAIGDLHLDALTKYWSNANNMQAEAVVSAAHLAVKRFGAKHIVLLGDVAEGIKDSTGAYVRLSELGQSVLLDLLLELQSMAPVHIICGNHDFSSVGNTSLNLFEKMSRNGLFKRVNIYTEPAYKVIDGAKVAFLPHPHKEATKAVNLAFAHYEVAGAVSDSGRVIKNDEKGAKGATYIQGHLHTKQKVRNHFYPGTLYQMSFGESLPKFFGMFHSGASGVSVKTHSVNPPFKLINLRVSKPSELKGLDTSPTTLYKLFLHESVKVPDSFLADHQNIVNALEYKDETELAALEELSLNLTESAIDLSIDQVLPDYLKAQGISKSTIRRALELHQRLLSSHK